MNELKRRAEAAEREIAAQREGFGRRARPIDPEVSSKIDEIVTAFRDEAKAKKTAKRATKKKAAKS